MTIEARYCPICELLWNKEIETCPECEGVVLLAIYDHDYRWYS